MLCTAPLQNLLRHRVRTGTEMETVYLYFVDDFEIILLRRYRKYAGLSL
jgi:hypothetical protein